MRSSISVSARGLKRPLPFIEGRSGTIDDLQMTTTTSAGHVRLRIVEGRRRSNRLLLRLRRNKRAIHHRPRDINSPKIVQRNESDFRR